MSEPMYNIEDPGQGHAATEEVPPTQLGVDHAAEVSPAAAEEGSAAVERNAPKEELVVVDPTALQSSKFQPRIHVDPKACRRLQQSIFTQGMHHPPLVRELDNGDLEIVCGGLRVTSVVGAWTELTVRVRRGMTDLEAIQAIAADAMEGIELSAWEKVQILMKLRREMELRDEPATIANLKEHVGFCAGQISEMTRTGENIDEAILTAAGVRADDLHKLKMEPLVAIGTEEDRDLRVHLLRQKLGLIPSDPKPPYEVKELARGKGWVFRLHGSVEDLTPEQAYTAALEMQKVFKRLKFRAEQHKPEPTLPSPEQTGQYDKI